MGSTPLEQLHGLGPKSAAWLREAGVATAEALCELGAPVVYLRVQRLGVKPSRNLLWALHGAIEDKPWDSLSDAEKARLEAEVDALQDGAA